MDGMVDMDVCCPWDRWEYQGMEVAGPAWEVTWQDGVGERGTADTPEGPSELVQVGGKAVQLARIGGH